MVLDPHVRARMMDEVVSGRWSVDDMIEVSVAASVGSGTDMPLVHGPSKDDAMERIFKEFEEYVKKSGQVANAQVTHDYSERRALPESVERKLRAFIRRGLK
jgi:hypothetical protein